jgi:hypothetical protein
LTRVDSVAELVVNYLLPSQFSSNHSTHHYAVRVHRLSLPILNNLSPRVSIFAAVPYQKRQVGILFAK